MDSGELRFNNDDITGLMIGNLLMYKGDVMSVCGMSLDMDDESEPYIELAKDWKVEYLVLRHQPLGAIQPIPLSPEILAGIEGAKNYRDGTNYKINISDTVNICIYSNTGYLEVDGEYNEQEVGEEIKYLHQLQNLYFALTGKPLQISLTKLNSNI